MAEERPSQQVAIGFALAQARALADAVDNPVSVLDAHGRVIYANAALGERLGRPAAALTGERLTELMPDHAAELDAARRRIFERGDDRLLRGADAHGRAERAARPGRAVAASFQLQPLISEGDGSVIAVACVLPLGGRAADIAPAPAAAAAGRAPTDDGDRLRVELRRANDDMQAFAYIASHDLQEPLRTISTCAAMLEKRELGRLDDKSREFLGYAIDAAKRMQQLIDDLLVFSRVGTNPQPFTDVDLERALRLALEDLEPTVAASGALITHDALPTVSGNLTMLSQLFRNLLDNAIKYRGTDAPAIHIACQRQGDAWEVAVRDNGIGIPPEFHERVFGIFKRLHGRARYAGSGAGLAIARRIVERHGGAIRVESTGANGSLFRFTLADRPPAPPAA